MQQINMESIRQETKYDPLGTVQETEIWPYEQMVYAQPKSFLENKTKKFQWYFDTQSDDLIMARR